MKANGLHSLPVRRGLKYANFANKDRLGPILFILLLGFSILFVYWRVFKYPLVQDDWLLLRDVSFTDTSHFLKDIFSPFEKVNYRPLGHLYFWPMYKLFGIDSIAYHVLAVIIHFFNSLLVTYVVQRITNNRLAAWTTGLLYATAIAVHNVVFIWAVGIYELGGAFLFFLSLALFLNERHRLSAVAFLLAILTKESVLFLPGILIVYVLLQKSRQEKLSKGSLHDVVSKLWPHFLILAAYIILRTQSVSLLSLPKDDPYKVSLLGPHILSNAIFYAGGIVYIILSPLNLIIMLKENLVFEAFLVTLLGMGLFITIILVNLERRERNTIRKALSSSFFWITWAILGIAPLLFYPNHQFWYYLTFALPPIIVMFILSLRGIALRFWHQERYVSLTYVTLILLSIVSSAYFFYLEDLVGRGASGLVQRANLVEIVRDGLLKAHPTLPQDTILVFDGEVCEAIGADAGPQVWYRDESLRVFKRDYLQVDEEGVYMKLSGSETLEKTYLNPDKTFIFNIADGKLLEIDYRRDQPLQQHS